MTAAPDPTARDTQVYLPDFCSAGTLFIILLVAELVAIVLTLASHAPAGQFLLSLSKISFFVLWLALLGTAVFAASGIMGTAFGLVFIPVGGVSQAVSTLVGQNLGANKPDRAEAEPGQKVRFQMNPVQERLYLELWFLSLVLKSRQRAWCTCFSKKPPWS